MHQSPINMNKEDLENHQAIGAIIKDKSGRILVQKHKKYGFWTIPIGKAKPNQSPGEGLYEEIFEECSLRINNYIHIATSTFLHEVKGFKVVYKMNLFEVTSYSGKIKNRGCK